MKEMMKKLAIGIIGIAVATIVLLLPVNSKNAYAYDMTYFRTTEVSSPLDARTKLNSGIGLGFETPGDPDSKENPSYYFYFDVPEKGWFMTYTDCTYDFRYNLCTTPYFTSKIDNNWWTDVDGMRYRMFYLDPGRYYIEAWGTAWALGWTTGHQHFTYFMPDSNVFFVNQYNLCNRIQYNVNSSNSFLTTEVFKGAIANRDASKGHGYSYMESPVNTYYINEAGEYTISIKFNSSTWEHFEFLKVISVTNLGSHSSTYQEIKKASFDKDGQILNRCSKCKLVVNSTPIYKISTIKFDKSAYTYSGSSIKPSITLYDSKNNRISKSYYDITLSNNKNIGKASAKITLKGSKYSGEKKVSFEIVPKATSIKTVTPATKAIKVSWKSVSGISGYEVQASTSSSFSSSKTKTVKVSKSNTSTTISKLKSNTYYYVRVRAYKTVSGKKYAAKWTSAKKVKVK